MDSRIQQLQNDVAEAQGAVGNTSKRLEAKYEGEKREALAAATARQRQLEEQLQLATARIQVLGMELPCRTCSKPHELSSRPDIHALPGIELAAPAGFRLTSCTLFTHRCHRVSLASDALCSESAVAGT